MLVHAASRRPGRQALLWIVALALLPLLAVSVVVLRLDAGEGVKQLKADRLATARAVAQSTSASVRDSLNTVAAVALAPGVTDPNRAALTSAYFAAVVADNPEWEGLGLIDPDGWNVTGSTAQERRINLADRPYFAELQASGQPAIGGVVVGRLAGVPTIPLAVPVDYPGGRRGALVAPLRAERLARALGSQLGTREIGLIVVDRGGRALVHPDASQVNGLSPLADWPEAWSALSGESGSEVRSVDGVEMLVTFTPVPEIGWGVLLVEPAAVAFGPLRQELFKTVGLVTLGFLGVAGVSWYLGGRLSSSYQRLAEARGQAEAAARRAAFLAEASRDLASSLDYEQTLQRLADAAVPGLADLCVVDLLVDAGRDGGKLRRVAIALVDPALRETVERLERFPLQPDAEVGLGAVLRTGQSELLPVVSDTFPGLSTADPEQRALIQSLGQRSIVRVPLLVRQQRLGVITLAMIDSGRRYDTESLTLAEELARRAAAAVDSALLFDAERRARAAAEEALKARERFISIASHELRTPVATIKLAAQVLTRAQARGRLNAEQMSELVGRIELTTDRLSNLVNDLLDVSRLEEGKLPLQLEPIDLGELVGDVVSRFADQLDSPHRLRIELPDEAWQVEADPGRLEQVLWNLLDNAAKYSPDGGEVVVTLVRGEAGVTVSVRDDGIGLTPGAESSLFEPFGRAPNAVARQVPGLGLGLYICRMVVERHGGQMWATSAGEGHGSTISFWLPTEAQARSDPRPPDTVELVPR
jgi:signal transduction histidine kinase